MPWLTFTKQELQFVITCNSVFVPFSELNVPQLYQLFAYFLVIVLSRLDLCADNVSCCDVLQKRVPIYNTMYSDLQRYPRYEVRLDTVDPVPRFIARHWRGQQTDAKNAALCYQGYVSFFSWQHFKNASFIQAWFLVTVFLSAVSAAAGHWNEGNLMAVTDHQSKGSLVRRVTGVTFTSIATIK